MTRRLEGRELNVGSSGGWKRLQQPDNIRVGLGDIALSTNYRRRFCTNG